MNPLYDQLFNPQFVNNAFLQTIQQQHQNEQNMEIEKAVKAIHEYFDATRKIAPEYQQEAFRRCIKGVLEEMGKNRTGVGWDYLINKIINT